MNHECTTTIFQRPNACVCIYYREWLASNHPDKVEQGIRGDINSTNIIKIFGTGILQWQESKVSLPASYQVRLKTGISYKN